MKAYVALAVLVLGVCLVQQTSGWYFGWGGLGGLGYGGYGAGAWGWPYYRYFRSSMSEGDITGRIQCRYFKERSVLSCTGASGVVECDTVSNFTGLGTAHKFEMYGLGFDAAVGKVSNDLIRYNLYPRSIDNKVWFNHTIRVEQKNVQLSLFHSWTYKSYGFRVNDLSCYERFVNLFKTANSDENVQIGGVTPVVSVPLFGEILVVNKAVVA